jgi:hypothetical protein
MNQSDSKEIIMASSQSDRYEVEIINCSHCGAKNKVICQFLSFGPANQERETGWCASCKNQIVRKKCFSISVEPVNDET